MLTRQPLVVIRLPVGTGFLANREGAQGTDSKWQPRILVKCLFSAQLRDAEECRLELQSEM